MTLKDTRKQMTTLTLKKTDLSPEKKEELKKLKALASTKVHLDKEITLADIQKAEKWLLQSYHLLFTKKHDKPLKIGVEKDIFEKEGDALPYTRSLVRKAIGYYVHHPIYLKCLLEQSVRYDLLGQEAGTIDDTHKENSQEILTKRQEKKNDKS